MSASKHTPGPWSTGNDVPDAYDTEWRADIDSPRDGVATSQPIFADDETIALVVWEGWIDRTGIANANLIAAAPDLLAALHNACSSDPDWELITSAIAKAEGRS